MSRQQQYQLEHSRGNYASQPQYDGQQPVYHAPAAHRAPAQAYPPRAAPANREDVIDLGNMVCESIDLAQDAHKSVCEHRENFNDFKEDTFNDTAKIFDMMNDNFGC